MRIIKNSLLALVAAALLVSFSLDSAESAGCKLTNADWGAVEATIGQPLYMYIRGEGCKGYSVSIHAYDASSRIEFTPSGGLTAVFSNDTSVGVAHTFNSPTAKPGQVFFEASANNTKVESKRIILKATPPPTATPPGVPGQPVKYELDIPNPIKANDFISLITEISKWITAIAIPIAVIAIVYAGILWLTAGAYPKNVEEAKRVLKYALIGLAIIIIGRGFITLIESIINLGGSSGTPATSQSATPPPGSATPPPGSGGGAGSVGSLCQNSQDCQGGPDLHCGSRNICQRASGNLKGEACMVSLNCQSGLSCEGASLENNRLGTCR